MISVATESRWFVINGVKRLVMFDPAYDTLASTLRRIGLTGVKIACGAGQCGACTVLLNGKAIRSCTRKMRSVDELSEIVTIEGLGTPEALHPLQQAWVTYGGAQCGFCTPGFIMSAKALLDENLAPTREEVRAWFQKHRNACRCTGYKVLVDAVMAAAKVLRGEMTMAELAAQATADGCVYGSNYPRPSAVAKVTGHCDYTADMIEKFGEGLLHLAPVFARCNRSRLVDIKTDEAAAMPGVYKIITYKDIKGTNLLTWPAGGPRDTANGTHRHILAQDEIYRYGEIAALVAAYSEREARDAAAKVQLVLEPLPGFANVLEAVVPGAHRVHPNCENIFLIAPIRKGEEPNDIIPNAPYVVQGSFRTQRQPHLVLEPDSALGYIDSEGRLTVQSKSLGIGALAAAAAQGLGLPADRFREVQTTVGGSFGYTNTNSFPALVGAAVLATGKPCALRFTYPEHNLFIGKRGESFTNLTLAADRDGKLCALKYETALDKGPYNEATDVIDASVRFFGSTYNIPNIKGLGKCVFTNAVQQAAFRGYGAPQLSPPFEQCMEMLAEKCGIDPFEFRARNTLYPGDTNANSWPLDVYPMPGLYDQMRPHYERARRECDEFNAAQTGPLRRGVGIAAGYYNTTGWPFDQAYVALQLDPDGGVTTYNTWEDVGQGGDIGTLMHTAKVLEPLGIGIDRIRIVRNDTARCPISGSAGASRSHYLNGNAYIDAANQLINAMRKQDGSFRSYHEMVAEGIPVKYIGSATNTNIKTPPLNPNTSVGNPCETYSYALVLAVAEVNTETGKTKVIRMVCQTDCGTISSRQAVDGGASGGMIQGLGFALSEHYDAPEKCTNLISCGFVYAEDAPDDLVCEYTETPRPSGPFGCSGVGEVHLIMPQAAVLNAVHNACGVWTFDMPATPEKVKAGIEALRRGEQLTGPEPFDLGPDVDAVLEEIRQHPMEVRPFNPGAFGDRAF